MIVSALESQWAQYTLHLLDPTTGIAGLLPTTATRSRATLIGGVGIETLLDRLTGQLQNLLANRDLEGFEIQFFYRLAPQQGLNLLNDVDG